jgi:hypothetical protein
LAQIRHELDHVRILRTVCAFQPIPRVATRLLDAVDHMALGSMTSVADGRFDRRPFRVNRQIVDAVQPGGRGDVGCEGFDLGNRHAPDAAGAVAADLDEPGGRGEGTTGGGDGPVDLDVSVTGDHQFGVAQVNVAVEREGLAGRGRDGHAPLAAFDR